MKNELHNSYVTMSTGLSRSYFSLLSNNRPVDFHFLGAVSTTQCIVIDDATDQKNEYIYTRACVLSTNALL